MEKESGPGRWGTSGEQVDARNVHRHRRNGVIVRDGWNRRFTHAQTFAASPLANGDERICEHWFDVWCAHGDRSREWLPIPRRRRADVFNRRRVHSCVADFDVSTVSIRPERQQMVLPGLPPPLRSCCERSLAAHDRRYDAPAGVVAGRNYDGDLARERDNDAAYHTMSAARSRSAREYQDHITQILVDTP